MSTFFFISSGNSLFLSFFKQLAFSFRSSITDSYLLYLAAKNKGVFPEKSNASTFAPNLENNLISLTLFRMAAQCKGVLYVYLEKLLDLNNLLDICFG